MLTRRMEAVISGLSKLEIDNTSEDEVVRTVAVWCVGNPEGQLKRTPKTGDIDAGIRSGMRGSVFSMRASGHALASSGTSPGG